MAGRDLDSKIGAFALGVAVGLFLNSAAKQLSARVRVARWHRDYEHTDNYDENLPDSFGRREPAPRAGQPRYGGTGALGVHPAAVGSERSAVAPETPRNS